MIIFSCISSISGKYYLSCFNVEETVKMCIPHHCPYVIAVFDMLWPVRGRVCDPLPKDANNKQTNKNMFNKIYVRSDMLLVNKCYSCLAKHRLRGDLGLDGSVNTCTRK